MGHVEHIDAEGVKIPSVSQIPALFAQDISGFEDWICRKLHTQEEKCCIRAKRDFYQESANLGNDVHELMAAFLDGVPFTEAVPEYQAALFDPVAEFFIDSKYESIYTEQQMTGKEFGGTLDTVGRFAVPFWEKQRKTFWQGGEFKDLPTTKDIWIVDLKIKSKLDRLHPLQLYGYSLLLKEVYGVEAKWGLIIRREKKLDKTPELQLKGYYLPAYKQPWESAMYMWHFLND